jgi:hypothetical protein
VTFGLAVGLGTDYLLWTLQFAGPRSDAEAPKQGDIKLAVDPADEVAPGRRYAALPLQHTKMVRVTP